MPLVMAHTLQKFLCDGDVGSVSSRFDKKTGLETVEVEILTRDKRNLSLVLELKPHEYKELINSQIEMVEKKAETDERPLGRKPKPTAVVPPRPAAEATIPRAPLSVRFSPPTEILETKRLQLSKKDPREKALLRDFEKAYPDRFFKRKKLLSDELAERAQRSKDIEIARSYILSGDRSTVGKWIHLLEEMT